MDLLLNARIKRIEDELADIKKLMANEPDVTIPENYMLLTDFVKKYKFISSSQLYKWVIAWSQFFKPVKKESRIYLDPIAVIDFVLNPPLEEVRSTRITNSLVNLRDDVQPLRELYEQWKSKQVKLPEGWGIVHG